MAPSRSTPRMMQVTRAAFQAVASLNQQATDPKSHTLVRTFYTRFSSVPLPANSDGRPQHTTPTYYLFERVNRQIRELNSQFVVILFDVDDTSKEQYIHFFQEKKMKFIDCSSPLYKLKDYRQPDGHPNARLNSLIADCVGVFIKKL